MHEIRVATIDDVHEIAQFQTEVWNETYRGLVSAEYLASTTVDVREARWGSRIGAGERSVFVACEHGRLDGVVSAGDRRDGGAEPTLELMSLYVRAQARGSGLGSRLLREAIKQE
ncbi:MAG TPA: GNAT family N-acetyltransferase, partial [Galbitalea sp.]